LQRNGIGIPWKPNVCITRFRGHVYTGRPYGPFRVSTKHSSVAPSSGSMITTSSNCGTHASAVYRPARLSGGVVAGPRIFQVADIPAPSDNDSPLQLCFFALPPEDGEIIDCGIFFESTSYRILRVDVEVSAQRECGAKAKGRERPRMLLGECTENVHCGSVVRRSEAGDEERVRRATYITYWRGWPGFGCRKSLLREEAFSSPTGLVFPVKSAGRNSSEPRGARRSPRGYEVQCTIGECAGECAGEWESDS